MGAVQISGGRALIQAATTEKTISSILSGTGTLTNGVTEFGKGYASGKVQETKETINELQKEEIVRFEKTAGLELQARGYLLHYTSKYLVILYRLFERIHSLAKYIYRFSFIKIKSILKSEKKGLKEQSSDFYFLE